jgi:hypothetical protein
MPPPTTPPPTMLPLTTPPPTTPPPTAPPLTMLPPQVEKNSCCNYKINKICDFDLRQCTECLKKIICITCQSTTSEYTEKYQFKKSEDYFKIMYKHW